MALFTHLIAVLCVAIFALQGLFVYLTEWEEFDVSRDHDSLVWNEDMVYGDWTGGPYRDGTLSLSMDISVPEVSMCIIHDIVHVHVYTVHVQCT